MMWNYFNNTGPNHLLLFKKKQKTDHPSQPSGFGYYFTAETSENFSLIVLRTPNTKCSVSAISTNNISLVEIALTDAPKDEILEQIGD